MMSRFFLHKTLITRFSSSTSAASINRCFSSVPESVVTHPNASELESAVVEKIEDAIHGIIVKKSKPDWLHFVPGASYWVPPRRKSYGIAEIVHNLVNEPTHEEHLSLASMRGLPSPEFYLNNKDNDNDESSSKTDSAMEEG